MKYRKNFSTIKILLSCFTLVVFLSCKKESRFLWQPDLALPVVNAEFSLKDIVVRSKNEIKEDESGFLTLVYADTLFSKSAEELINISPTFEYTNRTGFQTSEINQIIALFPNTSITLPEQEVVFDFPTGNDFEADSLFLKGGLLNIQVSSDFDYNVTANVKFPGMSINGVAFDENILLGANGNTPVINSINKNLNGFRLRMNENGEPNKLKMRFRLIFTELSASNTPTANDSIRIKLSINSLKFSSAYGKVNTTAVLVTQPDTAVINFFDNAISGGIKFKNPSLKTTIQNSFGISAGGSISVLKAFNPVINPVPANIHGSGIPSLIQIEKPTTPGQSTTTEIELTKLNSNIDSVIALSPSRLIYKLTPQISPTPEKDFVLDTSRVRVKLNLTLPMEGAIGNFAFRDTFEYNFNSIDKVERFTFRVNIDNGFPVETKLQVYFLTNQDLIVDSLIKNPADQVIIPACPIDVNGRAIGSVNKLSDFEFKEELLKNFSKINRIIIEARANSTGANSNPARDIKIYSDYKMKVRFGVRAKLKWEL